MADASGAFVSGAWVSGAWGAAVVGASLPDEQPNSASYAANAPAATSAPHFLIFIFLPFPLHPLFSNTISMTQSHYYTAPDALYQRSKRQEKG